MALPALLKKLFANEGAGNKLKKEIIPDLSTEYITNYENGTITSSAKIKGIGFGQKGAGESAVILSGAADTFGISVNHDSGDGTLAGASMLEWVIDPNKDRSGTFALRAVAPDKITNGMFYTYSSLEGSVHGSLTWDGDEVLTSAAISSGTADLNAGTSSLKTGFIYCVYE